jgi:hypothetical protein
MVKRRVPWALVSHSTVETARFLISQAGSVQAAHGAVTRAAKGLKQKRGRPAEGADPWWLWVAYEIQQKELCSDHQALCRAADRAYGAEAVDLKAALVRRLRRKMRGARFAQLKSRPSDESHLLINIFGTSRADR